MTSTIALALLLNCFALNGAVTIENIQFSNIAKSPNKELLSEPELQEISDYSNIRKIILIRAITSATADLDIINILNKLKESKIINAPTSSLMSGIENATWEAIIVTKTDSYYISIGEDVAYISSSKKYAYLQ